MLRIVTFCLGLVSLGLPAAAQDAQAIEDVITRQLDAFNDRDVNAAWTFASPMIKGMFGNPANFGMMVQNGYPMVWDNADVEFLDLREEDGAFVQRLTMRDADGVRYVAEYQMIETADGWQINGVSIVPAPDVGA
jgi:hypothetical protein